MPVYLNTYALLSNALLPNILAPHQLLQTHPSHRRPPQSPSLDLSPPPPLPTPHSHPYPRQHPHPHPPSPPLSAFPPIHRTFSPPSPPPPRTPLPPLSALLSFKPPAPSPPSPKTARTPPRPTLHPVPEHYPQPYPTPSHHAPRPFYCPYCPTRCDREGHLNVHVAAVHKKLRRFACEDPACPAAFGHNSSLLRHMKTFAHGSRAFAEYPPAWAPYHGVVKRHVAGRR